MVLNFLQHIIEVDLIVTVVIVDGSGLEPKKFQLHQSSVTSVNEVKSAGVYRLTHIFVNLLLYVTH